MQLWRWHGWYLVGVNGGRGEERRAGVCARRKRRGREGRSGGHCFSGVVATGGFPVGGCRQCSGEGEEGGKGRRLKGRRRWNEDKWCGGVSPVRRVREGIFSMVVKRESVAVAEGKERLKIVIGFGG
ncbi:hypothetical protein HAX54_014835, partial [Datura stramonium]|nr:hypothetical protein [Datura stramonium]